jgi:4-hydroxy-3-methylbut-2-en-1-yl diphosphate reductase
MEVTIDPNSGFCFGVVYAIKAAEQELDSKVPGSGSWVSGSKTNTEHKTQNPEPIYSLGDIVHNNKEVERLKTKGLIVINHEKLKHIRNSRVLIRAHGEPPETYRTALENNIELIDASCPVVLKLQNRIRLGFEEMDRKKGQIVIYGKDGHAEVNGLVGQTLKHAIIINYEKDLDRIDYTKPIRLYSQTTQSIEGYENVITEIKKRILKVNNGKEGDFIAHNSICNQVSNRSPQLKTFASQFDVIVFVSGKKSSNGLYLYEICKSANKNSYFISDVSELKKEWFADMKTVGVCGATSTPMWFMEQVADIIRLEKWN